MTIRTTFTSSLALACLAMATLSAAQTEMPAKEPAKVGPFEVAPHWSPYDYPKSIGEGQAFHMVVKGDTLWDIAGRYLENPYLWPQIWEANSYVKKARLIYPGDPIFLPSVQMADAPTATAELTELGEGGGEADANAADEALGVPEWLDPEAMINAASSDSVRYSGYISASIEDESLKIKGMEAENGTLIEKDTATTRDYVYLDRGASSGLKAGDLYTTHRRARVIRHPVTGKKVGHRIETTGVVRIVLVSETSARAVVETAGRAIEVGNYLRPLTEIESPLVKRKVVSDGGDLNLDGSGSTGYVVDIEDNSVTSAAGVVVGVDLGTGSGLSVGTVMTVFRQGDARDSVTRRALGAAVVVATSPNFAVARLVYSREEILVGDRVILQP